jgi:hypothetical protein
MKILYISAGDHLDYQDDCLSIGLKELFGASVVDVNKREHLYTSFSEVDARQMYGKGMSVTRILEDHEVDRSDIEEKIAGRYFDLVIYGSIARSMLHFPLVLASYPKSRVFVIDGEDHTNLYQIPLELRLPYFKRELTISLPTVFPISFAIPTVKFSPINLKTREIAICDPRDRNSYIYKSESDYYGGYKEACLAITTKKAGWDCMRHYEIMANGCLPLFIDIADCPDLTMTTFNKELCKDVLTDYYSRMPPSLIYEKHQAAAFQQFGNRNTTLALAKYIVSKYMALNQATTA